MEMYISKDLMPIELSKFKKRWKKEQLHMLPSRQLKLKLKRRLRLKRRLKKKRKLKRKRKPKKQKLLNLNQLNQSSFNLLPRTKLLRLSPISLLDLKSVKMLNNPLVQQLVCQRHKF
jgi:hypothetical protein